MADAEWHAKKDALLAEITSLCIGPFLQEHF
jgi:hypothetical protein